MACVELLNPDMRLGADLNENDRQQETNTRKQGNKYSRYSGGI
jgi:hypothetical protein